MNFSFPENISGAKNMEYYYEMCEKCGGVIKTNETELLESDWCDCDIN
jgi:hypothetical protein